MGIILSFTRVPLNHYRMIAKTTVPLSKEIMSLKKTFYNLLGSKVNLGRLLVFLKFAEDLELTEEK